MVRINYNRDTNYSVADKKEIFLKNFDLIQSLERDVIFHSTVNSKRTTVGGKRIIKLWYSEKGTLEGLVDGRHGYERIDDRFESCPQGGGLEEYLNNKFGKDHPDVTIDIGDKEITVSSDNEFGDITHHFLNKLLDSDPVKNSAQKLSAKRSDNDRLFTGFVYAEPASQILAGQ